MGKLDIRQAQGKDEKSINEIANVHRLMLLEHVLSMPIHHPLRRSMIARVGVN